MLACYLLAPRDETIKRSHGALLELLPFSETTLNLAAELPSTGADVRTFRKARSNVR